MTTQIKKTSIWRRWLVPMAGGALCGALGSYVFLEFTDIEAQQRLGVSREVAGLVGVLYAITGLSVLLGTLRPGWGGKYLNVEDADELREQRRMLGYSAIAMVLFGAAMMLLSIAGEGMPVSARIGAVGAFGLMVLGTIPSVLMRRDMDELQHALSATATMIAFYLVFLFGGSWAILAHLDLIGGPAPIDWLTMFFVAMLIGAFWETARRGLLNRGPN